MSARGSGRAGGGEGELTVDVVVSVLLLQGREVFNKDRRHRSGACSASRTAGDAGGRRIQLR